MKNQLLELNFHYGYSSSPDSAPICSHFATITYTI
jgi:hypothetical protein